MNKIFIHIPKNAGSSVIDIINIKNLNINILGHYPEYFENKDNTEDFISTINLEKFSINYRIQDNCIIFAIVRNPYTRLLSAYNYLNNGGGNTPLDEEYCNIIKTYTFDKFIDNLDKFINVIVHLLPQYIFICDKEDKILISNLCKYENLKNDLKIIDLEFENLGHINKSKNSIILTENIKEKIYKLYIKDFIIFGYEK